MRTESLVFASVLLAACQPPVVPFASGVDAAHDAQSIDMGITVVHDMGPHDTGEHDMGSDTTVDAPLPDTGPLDAGAAYQITLDGLFTEPYWETASTLTNTTAVVSPFDGDTLTALHFGRDDTYFYMGLEGTLMTGDAIVVYVDTHFGDGVMLSTGLGDTMNAVNSVLSLQITASAEFQPELGWGVSDISHGITTSEAPLGWRTLAANPGHFTFVTANTRSICSGTGCETVMLLDQIGVLPGGYMQLLVRLGRPAVGFSNQTFPVADTATPETVDLTISVPAAP